MPKDKLLTKLGFKPADVEAEDFDQGEAIKAYEEKQKEQYFKLFKNDTDYADEISKKAKEEVYKILDKKMAKLLPPEVMEANKQFGDKLKALTEQLSKDNSTDVKELQEKNQALQEKLDGKDEEIENAKTEANNKADLVIVNSKLRELFATIPVEEVVGSSNTAFKVVMAAASDKYDFRLQEGKLEVYQKGTEKKAEKDNTFLSVEDMLRDTLKAEDLVKESNGSGGGNPDPPPAGGERTSARTGDKFDKLSDRSKKWAERAAAAAK